jgi:integrase
MRVRGAGCLYLPRYTRGGKRKASGIWWWKRGKTRVSTGCRDKKDAEAWVLQRLAEMGRGGLVGLRASALTYEDCIGMLRTAHTLAGHRSRLQASLNHLSRYFAGWKAREITPAAARAYALKRRQAGAAVATVNVELARLRRALRLAWEAGRLERQPIVPTLPGANVRRGFLEGGDFEAILEHMPLKYHPPVLFLRYTGWRLMECLGLLWENVDRSAQEVRLHTSKTGEPRCVPYGSHPGLCAVIEGQYRRSLGVTKSPSPFLYWVFPGRAQRPLDKNTLQRHWKRARIKAGLPNVYLHDLRRTWVRDAERAGVPRSVAMSITGHRSEQVYRRYAISSKRDQEEALAKVAQLAPQRKVVRMAKKT